MIESGTRDEIKESILGNLAWNPDLDMLKLVRRCFEQQGVTVEVVTVKQYSCGQRSMFHWNVIAVSMRTKRDIEGAMAKTLRAVRAARLALYQFTVEGKSEDGLNGYVVELRGAA